jgi:hypothetical protein
MVSFARQFAFLADGPVVEDWENGPGWSASASRRRHVQTERRSSLSPLFSPTIEVLGTLLHELVHAAVGTDHGHKKVFSQEARRVGLTGRPTATHRWTDAQADFRSLCSTNGRLSARCDTTRKKCSSQFGGYRRQRRDEPSREPIETLRMRVQPCDQGTRCKRSLPGTVPALQYSISPRKIENSHSN